MAFLALNGLTIPVSDGKATQTLARMGRRDRSFRGQLRDTRRGIRETYRVEMRLADHALGRAIEEMVDGKGHYAALSDGLQCSTGLTPGPSTITGLRLNPAASAALGGTGYTSVPDDVTGVALSYDAQLGTDWTVMFERQVAGVWTRHAVRSDGAAFVGGLPSLVFGLPMTAGGNGLFVRVVDGVVDVIKDDDLHDERLCDLAILPYRVPDTMLASLTTAPVRFGPCPLVRVTGDMVGGASVLAFGSVTGVEVIQAPSMLVGYGWANNVRVVSMMLDVMSDAYVASLSL